MKTHTFTDEDFAKFKAKVEQLIDTLGLHDWHVTISHQQIGDRVAAQTQCNHVARHASIRLTKQNEGDFGIEWRDSINRVRDKKNNVGRLHRNECPLTRAFRKVRIWLGSDTARIDDLKWGRAQLAN